MTKILYRKSKSGLFREIEIYGHAGFSEKGRDIVCSGISSIVDGTIFFLKKKNCKFIKIKRGELQISFLYSGDDIKSWENMSLEMMIEQLSNISFFYPKYLNIVKVD